MAFVGKHEKIHAIKLANQLKTLIMEAVEHFSCNIHCMKDDTEF